MILRKLEKKDAPLMYEWMTAKDVNNYFRFDPSKVSIKSCEEFINTSFTDENKTYAIDIDGEYAGSISLKEINQKDKNAEFAISIREKYRGKGYGKKAIKMLLDIAFNELELNKVYLNVLSTNKRAIELYKSVGFKYEGQLKKHILVKGKYKNLKLFGIWRDSYEKDKTN